MYTYLTTNTTIGTQIHFNSQENTIKYQFTYKSLIVSIGDKVFSNSKVISQSYSGSLPQVFEIVLNSDFSISIAQKINESIIGFGCLSMIKIIIINPTRSMGLEQLEEIFQKNYFKISISFRKLVAVYLKVNGTLLTKQSFTDTYKKVTTYE